MSSTFNCVVWAAVSTKRQSTPDKFSLTDQVQRGQELIAVRGWRETHAPLVVRGESRQEHITLDEARAAIPELDTLLKLVQSRAVNMVVCIDNDRFRGLLDQVVRTLARYSCQLYSVYQPVEPQDPGTFDLYNNDAQVINSGLSQMMSTLYIANFRRKYKSGMKARVEQFGLPPNNLRFGYRKPAGREMDSKAIPIIYEPEAATLRRIKRDYLGGTPANIIAQRFNAEGLAGQRGGKWNSGNIARMVCDPFYAGFVAHNRYRTVRNSAGEKRVLHLPSEQWSLAAGKHEALWTEADWRTLSDLRRRRSRKGFGVSHRPHTLSSLLICGKCNHRLRFWRYSDILIYKCPNGGLGEGHGYIYENAALEQLRDGLIETIRVLKVDPAKNTTDTKPQPDETKRLEGALVANDEARARLQRLFIKGTIAESDLDARLVELENERAVVLAEQAKLNDVSGKETRQANRLLAAGDVVLRFSEWQRTDRTTFNGILLTFLDHIVVDSRKIIDIFFRDD